MNSTQCSAVIAGRDLVIFGQALSASRVGTGVPGLYIFDNLLIFIHSLLL